MAEQSNYGRVTIPTDLDVVPETLEISVGAQMPSATATVPISPQNFRIRTQRFILPTIPPGRITPGQRPIPTRCSSAIL